jgi:hypothetical protein
MEMEAVKRLEEMEKASEKALKDMKEAAVKVLKDVETASTTSKKTLQEKNDEVANLKSKVTKVRCQVFLAHV